MTGALETNQATPCEAQCPLSENPLEGAQNGISLEEVGRGEGTSIGGNDIENRSFSADVSIMGEDFPHHSLEAQREDEGTSRNEEMDNDLESEGNTPSDEIRLGDTRTTASASLEGHNKANGFWSRPVVVRAALFLAGVVSLALGAAGVVLPGLPTTPFILLAAFCFARSSERFHQCLLSNRVFGPVILEWRENRALPSRRTKAAAIAATVTCFAASIAYCAVSLHSFWWVSVILGALCLVVCAFLLRLPVVERNSSSSSNERV